MSISFFFRSPHLLIIISQAMSKSDVIQWRLQDAAALEALTQELLKVRPKLEQGQPVEATDGTETKRIKSSKQEILQSIFGIVSPLTPDDVSKPSELVWEGRNGWLKEYVQIANRRAQEDAGEGGDEGSSGMDDSDFVFDDIPPAGERRKSCTLNLGASNF